jgi:hypothetical protein
MTIDLTGPASDSFTIAPPAVLTPNLTLDASTQNGGHIAIQGSDGLVFNFFMEGIESDVFPLTLAPDTYTLTLEGPVTVATPVPVPEPSAIVLSMALAVSLLIAKLIWTRQSHGPFRLAFRSS